MAVLAMIWHGQDDPKCSGEYLCNIRKLIKLWLSSIICLVI